MNDENSGNDVDTVGSVSDADTSTPPMQQISTNLTQSNAGSSANTPSSTIPTDENKLQVDISDALSEKDKVKFTVHTRTTFPNFAKEDFFVVRQHEEFIWLHDRFEENEDYAGYIVSPSNSKMKLLTIFKILWQHVNFIADSTMSTSTRF